MVVIVTFYHSSFFVFDVAGPSVQKDGGQAGALTVTCDTACDLWTIYWQLAVSSGTMLLCTMTSSQ